MANKISLDVSNNITFVDGVQTTARTLDSIVKGDNSAHKTRHQDAGADEISLAGLSGEPADTVNKIGAQTIAGVKTFSDSPKMDAIAEKTADTGITVDGILIKDDLDTSGIVGKSTTQTLTNKTLTTPIIASLYQDAGKTKLVTIPVATDTLVGQATTDTLTNKTLTSPVINTPTGDVATITGVQTLTNKTLTTPKMNIVAEETDATGVTVDGVLIKDSLDVSGIVTKTGAQTIAGVKTLSDNLVFSGDKIIQTNVKARAYLGTHQENLVNGDWTKVLLDTENYDIGADFDTANNKFVAPVTGYYLVTIAIGMFTIVADRRYDFAIYKNNVAVSVANVISATTDSIYMNLSDILYLTATDYIEMFGKSNSGGNLVDIAASSPITFMAIHLLSV